MLSQPTLRREGNAGLTGASSMGGKCAESPQTFIRGKRQKNRKKCGLRTLSEKGSGVVFTHGEGISTPRVCHKGRQCWISPTVTFWSTFFLYANMFKGNPVCRKAHRIVKYLKLKRMNPSIELKEQVLDRVKFRNKSLLRETLIMDDLEQN